MIIRPAFFGIPRSVGSAAADFTIINVGDPHLNFSGEMDEWNALTDWIVANKVAENIQAVLVKGDFSLTGSEAHLAAAWSNGSPAKGLVNVDALNVPWLVSIGNHDYNANSPSGRDSTYFDAQLGYSRLNGKSWYLGYYNDGANSKATQAIRFSVGAYTFLVIALELFPRIGAMQWALNTIDAYPNDYVIVMTHAYLQGSGSRCVDSSTYGPNTYGVGADLSGEEMWGYLKAKGNVMMVISGHFLDSPRNSYLASLADNGNTVRQMFANYQELSPDRNGLVKMRFSPSAGLVYISDLDLNGGAGLITPFSFGFDAAATDVTAPTISNATTTIVGSDTVVQWDTDEPADSQVEYGATASYGSQTTLDTTKVLHHSVTIVGFTEGHCRILTRDAAGNLRTGVDMIPSTAKSRSAASGVSCTVDFGYAANFNQVGDISLGVWVKLGTGVDSGDIIAGYSEAGETQAENFSFWLTLSGSANAWDIQIGHEYDSGKNVSTTFNTNLQNDRWYYVGISRDATGKTFTLYVIDDTGTTTVYGPTVYSANPNGGDSTGCRLMLFNPNGSSFGYLDGALLSNFIYHSRALSQVEHEAQALGTPSSTGLILWAPLGQGTPEPDWGPNGYSGAVTNATISADAPPITY